MDAGARRGGDRRRIGLTVTHAGHRVLRSVARGAPPGSPSRLRDPRSPTRWTRSTPRSSFDAPAGRGGMTAALLRLNAAPSSASAAPELPALLRRPGRVRHGDVDAEHRQRVADRPAHALSGRGGRPRRSRSSSRSRCSACSRGVIVDRLDARQLRNRDAGGRDAARDRAGRRRARRDRGALASST